MATPRAKDLPRAVAAARPARDALLLKSEPRGL